MVKVTKNHKNINIFLLQLLLFLSIITFTKSSTEWATYENGAEYAEYNHDNGPKTQTVGCEFKGSIPYYIKVLVTPAEGISSPTLCFSPSDANCLSDRQAVAKRTDGKPVALYVKKDQFNNDNEELYVFITCVEDRCSYNVKFIGGQSAEIEPNTIFSYVITNDNRDMKFEVKNEGDIEDGSHLIIGVDGSSSVQLNVDNQERSPTYLDTGRIISIPVFNVTGNKPIATFDIKGGNIGDYITLNAHITYYTQAPDNLLYPNGPVVMGMLDANEGYNKEECFPISAFTSKEYSNVNKYYLTGRIHSKYALFWLADENNQFMEETETEIDDGLLSFLIENNGKKRSVCFEFSYERTENMGYVAYSISILEPTKMDNLYNYYPPQIISEVYRRMIPKGSYAVYSGAKISKGDKRISFNMYNRKGAAELFITRCSSYPYCIYTNDEIEEMKSVKRISRMAIWEKVFNEDVEALSSDKYVIVAFCRDDDNENKGYCEVDTTVANTEKRITVVPHEEFYKYVEKGEKGSFRLDFKGGDKIQRLTIDIMIYSGDVNFNIPGFENNKLTDNKFKEDIEITHYKYYLSNKIHYIFNFAQLAYECVDVEYSANLNSFFSIKYEINTRNLVQTEEELVSSESYLVQIDPTTQQKYKTVFLPNYRTKLKQPFLANFFALNCEFQVTRGEKEISFSDGYAQEILQEDTSGYNSKTYDYNIKVLEADLSNYNHKMCMLYVAGYESRDINYETEIIVGENVNQQVIFNSKFKHIRFLYPQADIEKDLAIYVNVIDQAYYKVNIYSNSYKGAFMQIGVTRSQIFYVPGSTISANCEKDNVCSIIVEASFEKNIGTLDKTDEPMIEITIRQIKNTPSYLQKSQAKRDFTCGDKIYYLYTDIGKNEIGEISVNFLRDFGTVWARIVRKDQTSVDDEANWRGIYRMPSAEWEDSFPFDGYTKKLTFGVDETQDCIEGCYLLLSIQVSQIGDYVEDSKFYPFSIISRITPNNYAFTDIPKVRIQVDEFIIGNVDLAQDERIYQFYEVWLPHDSYRVEFDFQSEVAELFINVGGSRSTTKNADFRLTPPGRDAILYIDKFYILKRAEERKIKIPVKDSLQDINLVIGVWTDKTDSLDTELFALTVRQPNDDINLDIVEVNTDQKILCTPRYLNDNQYRCLFMVTYDDEDVKLEMPLIVHAASVNQSAVTHSHASFIDAQYYDEYDVEKLRSLTPTLETSQYSTQRADTTYIYTKLVKEDRKKYFFVNVISDKPDDLFILTSLPMYNELSAGKYFQFFPNPTSEQLLSITVDKLNLKFFTPASLIINIVTLGGDADITWENDPKTVYYLRGRGDRLALTSGENVDKNGLILTKRAQSSDGDEAGFVFYISYYVRDPNNNFDEVQYGKSIEVAYKKTDLPVYLYSKIDSYYNDINIAVTFKDLEFDTQGEIFYTPFSIKAAIVKENTLYRIKKNPELTPTLEKSILGSYDPALKTVIVFLSSSVIRNFNVKTEDNPTLYLSIEKNPRALENVYPQFNIEAQFTKVNGALIPVEKTYNYGRHSGYFTNYYRLQKNIHKQLMAIELAFNSRYLEFAVSQAITRVNMTNLIKRSFKERGKIFLLLDSMMTNSAFIYINIFRKEVSDVYVLPMLYNYVFKYVNLKGENEFVDYTILNNDSKLEYKESSDGNITTIDCTFNKINIEPGQANITYFFKVVENKTLIYGEDINSIAVMESPYKTVYQRNPKENNGKITLSISGDLSNWAYLQVIAQIQQETILEYITYEGIENIRPAPVVPDKDDKKKDSSDSSKSGSSGVTVFLVVAGILLALIVGLVIVVYIFQQRNKSLLNQVKHVSFQQNPAASNTDPDLLLQKSQQSQ